MNAFFRNNARRMKPTKKHKVIMAENMLGTVWAVNKAGVPRYFDYDYDAAWEYTETTDDSDVRVFKAPAAITINAEYGVRKGQTAVYAIR